jgi:hypothetical protein
MTTFKAFQKIGCRSGVGVALVVATLGVFAVVGVSTAAAEGESSWWHLTSGAQPANLPPGGEGTIVVVASNLGDAPVDGAASPVTITDTLPAGLEAKSVLGFAGSLDNRGGSDTMSCAAPPVLSCTFGDVLYPYEPLEMRIAVKVVSASSGELNSAKVTGGLTPPASVKYPVTVSSAPVQFGVERYEVASEGANGMPETQAGSHPFQFTTSLGLNEGVQPATKCQPGLAPQGTPEACLEPPALPKDLRFDLPAGLIGNPDAVPQCGEKQFAARGSESTNQCPADTVLGVAAVTIDLELLALTTITTPIFNLAPSPGEPARFGFIVEGTPVTLDTAVRTGRDYGVVVSSNNISELPDFVGVQATFWGVPGDPRHDSARGWSCIAGEYYAGAVGPCVLQDQQRPSAFLTLPTSCTGELQSPMEADSWKEPANRIPVGPTTPLESLDSCNDLPFSAGIETAPDLQQASTPTGLKVDVHVPQSATLDSNGVAGADVKDIDVTLPEGVVLNPSGADGLEACSEGLVGYEGSGELDQAGEPGNSTALFKSRLPGTLAALAAGEAGPFEQGVNFCPDASKVAEVTIKTPLLPNPLKGSVYLAAQNENPFGSLVAMYLVAEDPVSGVLVKLPGEVSLNAGSGQITASFLNSPQLPFEDAELHFFGGDRAPLSTPAFCSGTSAHPGPYTTEATFTPWSGNEPVTSTSSFEITSGPNGGPCPGASLPFTPSFNAETTNINAGAFSPLQTTITREDGQQNIQALQLHFPPGLSGVLAGVKLCGEAEANAGTCGPASLIGSTIVSVGLGANPFTVTGGKVYLTGPYEGAPFGLSIVNPAVAGPFNLGQVIVRAKVEVNPITAALTVTTDNSGPYKIPSILDGIPLQIKHVNVTIEGVGGNNKFTFNPTNCSPTAVTGTASSTEGASAPVSIPFQVTNCTKLEFAPKFSVSTSGKTSKSKGASLTATLSEPAGSMGTQANITRVKVDLPKQLPSRLTTLQKACTAKQFELNPANCPKDSMIGYAKVTTPLLPVPLEGPAIFVSHGGEAFPSLTMVLQGYGVTIDLVGTTFISKKGITSTTFKTVPDVPFNAFTLTLPEGKFSALAANGNLCSSKLAMPTEFLAQNGLKINESTKVGVTGCPDTLSIQSHSVKKRTLALSVIVPAAGKLTISGKGVSKATKSSSGPATVRLIVSQKKAGKLSTRIKLSFTPKSGKKLSKSLTVKFKQ